MMCLNAKEVNIRFTLHSLKIDLDVPKSEEDYSSRDFHWSGNTVNANVTEVTVVDTKSSLTHFPE